MAVPMFECFFVLERYEYVIKVSARSLPDLFNLGEYGTIFAVVLNAFGMNVRIIVCLVIRDVIVLCMYVCVCVCVWEHSVEVCFGWIRAGRVTESFRETEKNHFCRVYSKQRRIKFFLQIMQRRKNYNKNTTPRLSLTTSSLQPLNRLLLTRK